MYSDFCIAVLRLFTHNCRYSAFRSISSTIMLKEIRSIHELLKKIRIA